MTTLKITLIILAILFLLFILFILGCYNIGKEMNYYRSCGHNRRSDL